jgi:hypothetical protein
MLIEGRAFWNGLLLVFGGVRHVGDLESFLALVAGSAWAAVYFATLIAAPGVFVGDIQGGTDLDESPCRR